MLKVLHTGDWHIGSFPGPEVGGQNARFQDICRCLDFQAMYAEEHRPDLIVVSGDIFHQARVWSDRGLRESRTAIDHIRRLSNVAPTVVLRGTPNHDSEEQFEMLTTAFYGDDSVSVVTEPEVLHIHTYHGQRVDVACIPGFDRGVHRAAHPGLSREEETQVFTDELAKVVLGLKAQCEPGVTSILSTHFTVPGCNMESGQTALFAQFEPVIYPDQIVRWMMILVLEPVFMRGMCETNCGSVPGRGAHYGKKHIEKWYKLDRKNTKYCAKLDIRKFYPSSKAPAVMQELRHVIKCKRMLRLCETVLNSSDGLPIGNYTSQWFANFLLQRLDHFIKEVLHIRYFVRYMDDMCLWASSKKLLHRAVKAIEKFLAGLGLVLKANWQVFPTATRAVDFLGFRFFREKTTLRKNLALRLRRRVKKTYKHTQKTGRVRARDAAAVMSYCGWLKHAHCHGFFVKYVKPYVNFKKLKEAIRHEARIRARTAYCVGNAAQPRTV